MKLLKEIPACFWKKSKIGELSTHEKLLLIYMIIHPATNRLGCFRFPLRYMADDLEWSEDYTKSCFNELIEFNFLIFDATTEWSYLTDFLDWFPIKNSYQGQYIEHAFNEIPLNSNLFRVVVGHLIQIPYLDKVFRKRLINFWNRIHRKEERQAQKELKRCQCGETIHA